MGVGAAVALGATAISRARARSRTRGRCLGLQLRHEWLSHVLHARTQEGWQGRLARFADVPNQRVGVVAWDHGDLWRLMFGVVHGPGVDARLASAVASTVAQARLRHPGQLDAADLDAVRRHAERVHLEAAAGDTEALGIPGAYSIGAHPGTT
jgi:hypothetical protein